MRTRDALTTFALVFAVAACGGAPSGGTASGGASGDGGTATTGGATGAGADAGPGADAGGTATGGDPAARPASASKLFAHYMPWFASKPVSGAWGWHWTMNARNPDTVVNGVQDLASHYHPVIGAYDSGDAALVEYHVLLMKYAGLEGAIADWYGIVSYLDYGIAHRNTGLLFDALRRAGMSLALCYEDQSIKHMIEGGAATPGDAVTKGQDVMRWLDTHWFEDPAYVHENGQPLLLNFGPQYFGTAEWNALFSVMRTRPSLVTLDPKVDPASGFFFWPKPQSGEAADRASLVRLLPTTKIPAAYPRFDDFYAQAGVGPSYGSIGDRGGAQYEETLKLAYGAKPAMIQLVTWNDWGEGTNIEPSVEIGFRDLQKTQELARASGWSAFPWTADDLQLPLVLYEARKAGKDRGALDAAATELYAGHPAKARALLAPFAPLAPLAPSR